MNIDDMESILKTGNCDHVITTDPNTTVYYSIKFISGVLEIQEDNTPNFTKREIGRAFSEVYR